MGCTGLSGCYADRTQLSVIRVRMGFIDLSGVHFTPKSDVVNGVSPASALLAVSVTVDTLLGHDVLSGRSADAGSTFPSGNRGGVILQRSSLVMGPDDSMFPMPLVAIFDRDILTGEAVNAGAEYSQLIYGLYAEDSAISMGIGADRVSGKGSSSATVKPNFTAGIHFYSGTLLDMGSGGDCVEGRGFGVGSFVLGIFGNGPDGQTQKIVTGSGGDSVIGIAESIGDPIRTAGIAQFSSGDAKLVIETGTGSDSVQARASVNGQRANGFFAPTSAQLMVSLGSDADKLIGFGTMTADGGSGVDVWDLRGYRTTEFQIAKTNPGMKAATFNGPDGGSAEVSNFEFFLFDNGVFSYATLPAA